MTLSQPMTQTAPITKTTLEEIAKAIRGLSIDGIETAKCGHPGLPLGCAEIGAYLYAKVLKHNPKNPNWINRDRFILSAGHGSMLLYSLLHLAGFGLSIEDLKNFRKYNSPTAGHPEFGEAAGIETTTGPLGQGFATAIGIALGNKMKEAQFGVEKEGLLNNTTYVLAGDGDFMEGISAEASSLAGHLALDNLVVIYDSNDICLDGPTEECLSEDTAKRYEAYGWHVQTINGHNFDELDRAFETSSTQNKPCLIIAKTTIGKGSPNLEGTSEIHGKAMGEEEANRTKSYWGIPETPLFHVPDSVKSFFDNQQKGNQSLEDQWNQTWKQWAEKNPEQSKVWQQSINKTLPSDIDQKLKATEIPEKCATRQASNAVLQTLQKDVPFIVGGSADLSCSDSTMMKGGGIVSKTDFSGRNIKYGVREFAMGAMCTGLALQGMSIPYCGTFLMFSDYMRNAIRLAALMKSHVVYQFTHDSVLLGEDGPTHQPVEHLASLRAMPGLTVIRPCDQNETKGAWATALKQTGPVALILSRQAVTTCKGSSYEGVEKGGYIISPASKETLDYCLLATGSEVELALMVQSELEKSGHSTRVVSLPSFEQFNQQSKDYQNNVLGNAKQMVSIEAQTSFGWHQYIGRDGIAIAVNDFGISAPLKDIQNHFGFTTQQIVQKILNK